MSRPHWSARPQLARGVLVLLLGLGGFVSWSLVCEINGAVVAPGRVMVQARRQAIQHPDGGLVVALHVRDGTRVDAGDPILSLDGTDLVVQRAMTQRELMETLARQDRLLSEIRGIETVNYRQELREPGTSVAERDSVLAQEMALFEARRVTLHQSDAQLRARQVQTRAVISGRERQLEASRRQLELVQEDLAAQKSLLDRGLTEIAHVRALRREAARLEGGIGELEAGIAEARSSIAGFEVERLHQNAAFREAAQRELRDLQPRAGELRDRLRLLQTRIGRLVLRAPMRGTLHGLQVHTVGGVVPAGAEIASIIPVDVPLVLSVEIEPGQIDRVHAGQGAMLRFPNFNARTTPEVTGQVTTVSADTLTDPATGRRFFVAELTLAPGAEDRLAEGALVPGMPVEAFIRTQPRTPASFLIKPLADYWAYAMREK